MSWCGVTRFRAFVFLCLMGIVPFGIASVAFSAEPKGKARPKPPGLAFVDITDQAGVRHRHYKPVLDKKLDCIMPWMASVGASAAAADYDKDGDIDLYVVNSQLGKPSRHHALGMPL